jgi:flagellin-specific chaperone FliS
MDERSYKWFLQEVSNSHLSVKILETGICRGTKVTSWFGNTKTEEVFCRATKVVTKTRYLLNYFLNIRVPMLEEYAPEKIVCFLYHRNGKKLVTAKEAIELAENQLHGLQVTSIHMAITSYTEIFTVVASNVDGELATEVTVNKFGRMTGQSIKDHSEIEKIINFLVHINELLVKFSNKEVQDLTLDLTKDLMGALVLVKITDLKFKVLSLQRTLMRKSSIKLITQESSSEESLSEEELPNLYRSSISSYINKDKTSIKIPTKKPQNNSQEFLEMIGKTIDKDRKKIYENIDFPEDPSLGHLKSQRKSFRESRTSKKSWDSLNDLLFYLEKTRPKVWVKDLGEVPATARNLNRPSNCEVSIQTVQRATPKTARLKSILSESRSRIQFRTCQDVKKLRNSV